MTQRPASPDPGRPRNTGRPRDDGRAGVYAGEDQVARLLDRSADYPVVEVAASRIALPPERHFGDLASVQRYVDGVLALNWVARSWPERARVPVTVRARRGASRAHYERETASEAGAATIAVPVQGRAAQWALRELVVLHELAHHLAPRSAGPASAALSEQSSTEAPHGPGFTGRMLALAGGVMGEEVAFLLRVAWADQGVPIG